MLHDREQLHMGVTHLLDIGHQIASGVPVGEKLTLAGAAPGPQMAFVDVHGPAVGRVFGPVVHPAGIPPGILIQLIDLGRVPGTGLSMEGVWIGLGRHRSVLSAGMCAKTAPCVAASALGKRLQLQKQVVFRQFSIIFDQ